MEAVVGEQFFAGEGREEALLVHRGEDTHGGRASAQLKQSAEQPLQYLEIDHAEQR